MNENENRDMYEEEGLKTYLANHPAHSDGTLLRGIIDVLKFMNKAQQSDEITLLVLEYQGKK